MRFYFKKESLERHINLIYWREINSFIETQSKDADQTGYSYIVCGTDEYSCLLYETLSEKCLYNCDFYIALDSTLKIPQKDFYLSSVLSDEQDSERRTVCLFPTGAPLVRSEKAGEIWIIIEGSESVFNKLLQQEVISVAELHGTVKIFTSSTFENLDNEVLRKEWKHCKKLISFSKNKALNHWFYILLGEDFILYHDDGSSPIRYAKLNIRHPLLQGVDHSEYDKACVHKYDTWTSSLRSLNVRLRSSQNSLHVSWRPNEALIHLAEQCLDSKIEKKSILFKHLKTQRCFFPFALPKWQRNKNSLLQLMDFVKKNPGNSDMQKLLGTYLFNFLPQEHWYKIEHFFAAQKHLLHVLHKAIELLETQFNEVYSVDFAYGTYIRAIHDQQKYACGWKQNLATCFDFCLNQNFDKILEWVETSIKGGSLSGVKLTKLLLTPLLVFKKEISKKLIKICRELIAWENTKKENIYGKSIFYEALLYLLEDDKTSLTTFLKKDFDPIKTQGYLGCLGLFLIKYDACYTDLGKQLLNLEKLELLAKKPLSLQTRALGMLNIGDRTGYEACVDLLAREKTYFKRYDIFSEKWFIQAKIEEALGHKNRAKRFRFLHNSIGEKPCLWEMFE